VYRVWDPLGDWRPSASSTWGRTGDALNRTELVFSLGERATPLSEEIRRLNAASVDARDADAGVDLQPAPRPPGSGEPAPRAPRVFISYSHDSVRHRERVLRLSERLRGDGIDASIDQYVKGTPDATWPRWTLDQVDRAGFVLVVRTEAYYRGLHGSRAPTSG
jgi:hypothetical protein